MIENLDGIRETVNFKSETHLRLFENVELDDYPLHWHAPMEIIMPLDGHYPVTCNNHLYDLQVGDILFITPGSLHSIAGGPGKRLILLADFALLHGIKELAGLITLISPALLVTGADTEIHGRIRALMLDIAEEYAGDVLLHEAAIYAKLIEILVVISRHYSDQLANNKGEAKRRDYIERFMFVCDYISEHFNENLTLDQIADLSGFSKFHFSRLFKQFTNMSFYKYLNRRRIENASRLLIDDELTITEVAYRCGFGSSSAFIRMFKIIRNCTPSEFKALHSGRYATTPHIPGDSLGFEDIFAAEGL